MRSNIEYPYDAMEEMILDFDPQYQVEVNYKHPADSGIPKLRYDTFAADLKVFTATMTNGTFRGVHVRDDLALLILMQPTERSKNGRKAYKALYERCLGQNYDKTQINAINAQIRSTQYNGEQGNSNWKAFDTIHRNARNKLNFFKCENPNYAGLNDGTHCSQILTNIHAKELDAAISTIHANKLTRT
eukprot:g15.t1 g15   contig1:40786-41582(+)